MNREERLLLRLERQEQIVVEAKKARREAQKGFLREMGWTKKEGMPWLWVKYDGNRDHVDGLWRRDAVEYERGRIRPAPQAEVR
jgi:hypothetical protein